MPLFYLKHSFKLLLFKQWYFLPLIALLISSILESRAQGTASTTTDLLPPYFIPKSPTVSFLPRFDTQQLVNLPTGAAQVAVPITEVRCGTLRLSVSLAYSYTGLQVGQPRDLVGLGWALQAGASITRQVNGLVDEDFAQDPTRRYDPDAIQSQLTQYSYQKMAYENEADTGPDLYSFSLPTGLSGRFVMRDTTAVLFPQQPVHIRRLGPQGFQITTEDGARYQFLAAETTEPNPNNFGKVSLHSSAWHLTHLISADNADTLHLYYTSHKEALHRQSTLTTGQYYTGAFTEVGNVKGGDSNCGSPADYAFRNVQMAVSRVTAQYLDSITTRGSHLLLTRATSTYELRRLQVVSTIGERREIKQFMLFQSRFEGGTDTDYRLRLDSLQESARDTFLPAYRFTYNTDKQIPARISAAKDYWGYANGAIGNGDFYTTIRPTLLTDPHMRVAGLTPANREPDFTFATVGALELIRYPTGGTSRWSYESGRMAYSDLQDVPRVPVQVADIFSAYNENNIQTVTLVNSPPINPPTTKQVTASSKKVFQVPEEDDADVLLSRTPYRTDAAYGPSNSYRDFNIWRRLPAHSSLPLRDSLITNLSDNGSAYKSVDPDTEKRFNFHLLPGTYVAQVYCEYLEVGSELTITIHYHDSTQVKLGLPGPGIRVARTTTIAPGAPPLIRTYSYTLGGYSSGRSLLPNHGKDFDKYPYKYVATSGGDGAFTGAACQFVATASDDRGLGNDFNKYDFYYAAVTEETIPNQGRTSHSFTHLAQQFNDVVPISEVVYGQNSAQSPIRPIIQSTFYTYLTDSLRSYVLPRMRLAVDHTNDVSSNFTRYTDAYVYQFYDVHAAFVTPRLTKQLRYDTQGTAFTTLTRSTYQRQRLIQTATRTSTGWTIQRFKRLSDYAPSATVPSLRVNSFNPITETQTWYRTLSSPDSLLVASHLTLYHPVWHSPVRTYRLRLYQPQPGLNQETQLNGRYTALLSDTHYELETNVHYATSSGDPTEYQLSHGQPTSFLLGYDRTLVITEAKNAAYAQIAYTSFEPEASGRWRYDSTGTHRVVGGRTGRWAYQLDGTAGVTRGQLPTGEYELTYWVRGATSPTMTVLGGSPLTMAPQLIATAPNNWHQYRSSVRLTKTGAISLDATGTPLLLDEVRLCPVGAQLTSYTHDPLVGMTSQTGPDERITFYEYDALGRLVRTRDEQGRILSQQQYHYAQH